MFLRTIIYLFFIVISTLTPRKAQAYSWGLDFGMTHILSDRDSSLPHETSAAFMISRSIVDGLSAWGGLNLPITPSIDPSVHIEPTFMLGSGYRIFEYDLGPNSTLDLNVGVLLGRSLEAEGRVFPISSFRINAVKNNHLTVHCGISTSPLSVGNDLSWGLTYGVGLQF